MGAVFDTFERLRPKMKRTTAKEAQRIQQALGSGPPLTVKRTLRIRPDYEARASLILEAHDYIDSYQSEADIYPREAVQKDWLLKKLDKMYETQLKHISNRNRQNK